MPRDEAARLEALQALAILDTAPEIAYDDLVRIATGICGTPMGTVSLIDADRQWFKARHGVEGQETPRSVSFCGHAILHPDELLIVPDTHTDPRFRDNPMVTGAPHVRFYAGAPVSVDEGQALGTLCVFDTEPKLLSAFQTDALAALARQVGILLRLRRTARELGLQLREQAWYETELRRYQAELESQNATLSELSQTDPLTRLPNRRAFDQALFNALAMRREGDATLAVAVLDIDHFKTINDRHGHAIGDEVLVALAELLRSTAGSRGVFARYGGEEFVYFHPDCSPDSMRRQCDHLRESIQYMQGPVRVTASIGYAVHEPGEDAAALMARADRALYMAKHGGRNRVMTCAR
ncbi:sensor domain-containing diguanylate cyclase [Coralloluteibacterium stylophorae]|uniref:diguanylate cyclase n=2 Tax=Coralloluteibacterium stylophorae TaxID=1776034 RepID=A0A8J8AZZ3_9GAMM|nr:sensor domain-containing diguanylate cyclase [Coralloluteibacterium stylophorae]MBS7458654.1 sensor domain-containing diguanylate cyclase [Coralloluteibacterium stylophorae]